MDLPDAETTDGAASEAIDGRDSATARRFDRRKDEIIAAAIPVLNAHGVKGMRLAQVAEKIGLKSTGITYYFSRKEELAVACLEAGVEVFHELLEVAEREPTALLQLRKLVALFVERDGRVRCGEAVPLASFASIRALEGDQQTRAATAYRSMFVRAREIFSHISNDGLSRADKSLRTMIMLEQLYWANDWLGQYDLEEFPRLSDRIAAVMANGLAQPGMSVDPILSRTDKAQLTSPKDQFLLAATREINLHSYRGASVDRISAGLNRTKGAFYHHNHAKDDLVQECFRRTFAFIRDAQHEARATQPDAWTCLVASLSEILNYQLSEGGALLRTAVLSSLPREHQIEVIELSYRSNRAFALMISDAISEGSARPVDPAIAAHLLGAAINVASDVRNWRRPLDERYLSNYLRALLQGLAAP